jgi:hypothetical protein
MRYFDRFGTEIFVDMYIKNTTDGSVEKVVEHDNDCCILSNLYESRDSFHSLRIFALEYCPEEIIYLDNFEVVKDCD